MFISITPFLFPERATTRLSLSRSNLTALLYHSMSINTSVSVQIWTVKLYSSSSQFG
nr:MAG TPA: hypothetical protein [Bacteriophage sp.]